MHKDNLRAPNLPEDVARFLQHLGSPATEEASEKLGDHFIAQAEKLKKKAAGLEAAGQFIKNGGVFQVEPIVPISMDPPAVGNVNGSMRFRARRDALSVMGIDVPANYPALAGLERCVSAEGAFDVKFNKYGVSLSWEEPLQEDYLVFTLVPANQNEAKSMASHLRLMADGVEEGGALIKYHEAVPADKICAICAKRTVRPASGCDSEVIRNHRHLSLCPVCAPMEGLKEAPAMNGNSFWSEEDYHISEAVLAQVLAEL